MSIGVRPHQSMTDGSEGLMFVRSCGHVYDCLANVMDNGYETCEKGCLNVTEVGVAKRERKGVV